MPRPLQLFRGYEFFAVLLPGLASVIFLYLLLPVNIQIGFPAGIIFVLAFSFVFGQALHSVALFLELLPDVFLRWRSPSWSHRQEFKQQLNDPTYVAEHQIINIREEASAHFPKFENRNGFSDNIYSSNEMKTLYLHMRSYLKTKNQSQSGDIKSMYGFCRNMCVLMYGLIPLYGAYALVGSSVGVGLVDIGIIDRQGKYIEFFPNYMEFLESAIPLAMIGGTIFLVGTIIYQRFFIQYLISDYITARREEKSEKTVVYAK